MTKVPIQNHAPDLSWPPEAQRRPPVFPPVCASAWGDDRYGLWIDVAIGGLVQRYRWIEPGEFWMGSPADEVGRFDHEGPRHVVRLTEGYWLAETACNQAVWQAVMGSNPSHFTDNPKSPVERVSWNEVQGFLREMERRLLGVKADLPTEAEWEYACRSGRETAFSWGDQIMPDQANYDASIDYAGGPTGKYRQKTVPVKSYTANAWGLYQMHGNVWEWCADDWRVYDCTPQVNPRGPASAEEGAPRAVRGGSWIREPRGLRAAFRFRRYRDERDSGQSFRVSLRIASSPDGSANRSSEAVVTRDLTGLRPGD